MLRILIVLRRGSYLLQELRNMSFPLKLEIVFPVMFPDSDLRVRNHQAWVDCQQTQKVASHVETSSVTPSAVMSSHILVIAEAGWHVICHDR
jgi:hypothetical protein